MKVFINPDHTGITQEKPTDEWVCHKNCTVSFCGVKIFGVVYVDTSTGFVRTSIPLDKHQNFEDVAKSLFNNFKKLGKHDSGNYGYEFTAPNLEVKFS